MALFETIFSKKSPASRDASKIYSAVMQASRNPAFFGPGRVSDSYEGRLDVLSLHLSGLFSALRKHGEQGALLSQAIYDVMIDDFDSALREEGLTDSGVKRRIKPMVSYVFARIKEFDNFQSQFSNASGPEDMLAIAESFPLTDISPAPFIMYTRQYSASVDKSTFGQLASGQITFPAFGNF